MKAPALAHGEEGARSGVWARLPGRAGAFWALLAMAAPRLSGTVATLILRRFLGPGIAGTFDLALAPYNFLNFFRNFGTGPALIVERTVDRRTANTAWTLNMIMAIAITAVAQLLARPIALYYRQPEVEGVFRVLSIAYVFASISAVHSFLLMRDLDFRARAIPAIGQVIAAGDIAILFVVWGFGIGSLVVRELSSVLAGTILLWAVYPFRPRIELVPSIAWKLFRYGAWIGSGLTILYLSQNVDVFIGGRIIHNVSDVGFYTTSWNLSFTAAGTFAIVGGTVVFPTLSRLHGDVAAFRLRLLTAIRLIGLVMFPAAALVATLAPVLIVPLLGEKWGAYRASFAVLSLLAVYAGNRTMLNLFFEGYKALGRPWIVLAYNAVKLAIIVPAIIVGAQHGIVGLAATYVPVQILELPAALILAHQVLGISPLHVWKAASTPILATLLMAGAVIVAEAILRSHHAGDLRTVVYCIPLAAAAYTAALALLDRRVFHEARTALAHGF